MSTPAEHLVDPNTGVFEPPNGMLSPKDRASMGNDVDPQQAVTEYQQARETQQNWLDNVELQRIQQENAQMRSQLQEATTQMQQNAVQTANLQGQLTQLTSAQQAERDAQAAEAQFAWTDEELQNHGEIRGLIQKEAGRIAHQSQQAMEAEIERRVQERLDTTVAPLQQKLEQTDQALRYQSQMTKSQFDSQLNATIDGLGLPNIHNLVQMPEFTARFSQNFAPGDTRAWGDVLKDNITNMNIDAASAMLRDFRDNNTQISASDNVTPSRSAPRVPQTPQEQQATSKREALTAQLASRMDNFAVGVLPPGETKAQYRAKNHELRQQIDAISTT